MVDMCLRTIGKSLPIYRCRDHWHADLLELATGALDQELGHQPDCKTEDAATYDLCWKLSLVWITRSTNTAIAAPS